MSKSSIPVRFCLISLLCLINFGGNCIMKVYSQPAITCSKLTIETLEKGGKYVQS